MVALMTRGRLGSPLSGFGSSDSEDVAEQQLHLQDRHSVNGYQESETKESTDLEQLFKSFAGNRAVAEMAFKGRVHLKIKFCQLLLTLMLFTLLQLFGYPHSSKYLLLCSSVERKSYRFGTWNLMTFSFFGELSVYDISFSVLFRFNSMFNSIYYIKNVFKCYLMPGIQSDSEESTNYHTINQTFDVTNGVLDATSQTEVIQFSFVPFH